MSIFLSHCYAEAGWQPSNNKPPRWHRRGRYHALFEREKFAISSQWPDFSLLTSTTHTVFIGHNSYKRRLLNTCGIVRLCRRKSDPDRR